MYGDLVQGNFMDTYRNLTYKTVLGHMWVSSFCSQAEFVVKTDDEIYVDIYGMYALTRKFVNSWVSISGMCWCTNNYCLEIQRKCIHDGRSEQVLEESCSLRG